MVALWPPEVAAARDSVLDLKSDFATESLSSLTAAELSLTSSNSSLDVLTRQRAYALFVTRLEAYKAQDMIIAEEEDRAQDPHGVFEENYNLSVTPLSALTARQLLTMPFLRWSTQSLVTESRIQFLTYSSRFSTLEKPQCSISAERVLVRDTLSGETLLEEVEYVALDFLDGAMGVTQRKSRRILCSVSAASFQSLLYLAGPAVPGGNDAAIKIPCTAHILEDKPSLGPVELTVHLGVLETHDVGFKMMRALFRKWSKRFGYKIDMQDASSPDGHGKKRSLSSAPPSSRDDASRLPGPKRRRSETLNQPSHSPASSQWDVTDHSRTLEGGGRTSALWKFVDPNRPSPAEWNPGFYTRQAALLTAFDPQAQLDLPTFSEEEVALLSCNVDPANLPVLGVERDLSVRYRAEIRLAVEKIYNSRGFVQVDSVRWVIAQGHIHCPDLVRYVEMVAKLVQCRDVFKLAWPHCRRTLETRLDRKSFDPITQLITIVEGFMRTDSKKIECLMENGRPISSCIFSEADIGIGPLRRFQGALCAATRFETEAEAKYPAPP